jgi:hypothetical protein
MNKEVGRFGCIVSFAYLFGSNRIIKNCKVLVIKYLIFG